MCFVLVCSDRAWEVLGDLKAGLGRGPRGWEVRAWKNESTGSRRDKQVPDTVLGELAASLENMLELKILSLLPPN